MRIKSRELKLEPWPAAQPGPQAAEGTEARRLDREEAPNVLEMGGGNGQNGQNGQPAPRTPAGAAQMSGARALSGVVLEGLAVLWDELRFGRRDGRRGAWRSAG